jgi:16S rRNA (adenine1518-N6/adenine1519-N6)-dimethyltransferase
MPKLGQHFLANLEIVERIISAARLQPGETVIEIGPGRAALTEHLLSLGAGVTAIELDAELFKQLKEKYKQETRLNLIHADFLKLDLAKLPESGVFVANLPYAVAAPILQRILSWPGWKRAVLMFQKEVAERLLAGPGTRKYGLLTVTVAMKAHVEKVCDVPKRYFKPAPQVDSMVVRLERRTEALLPAEMSEEKYLDVVKAAFAHRRKTVINSLSHALRLSKADAESALKSANLDPGCRAEDISPEAFVLLADRMFQSAKPLI